MTITSLIFLILAMRMITRIVMKIMIMMINKYSGNYTAAPTCNAAVTTAAAVANIDGTEIKNYSKDNINNNNNDGDYDINNGINDTTQQQQQR